MLGCPRSPYSLQLGRDVQSFRNINSFCIYSVDKLLCILLTNCANKCFHVLIRDTPLILLKHFISRTFNSGHSINTSQTLHLKNMHFPSFSTSHYLSYLKKHSLSFSQHVSYLKKHSISFSRTTFLCSVQHRGCDYSNPSYTDISSHLFLILYCSAHFSPHRALYTPHSFSVPLPFHILYQLPFATPGT